MGETDEKGPRRIVRDAALPGSRALLGALLVVAAAVGVFAAHSGADAAPADRYVVVRTAVAPGETIQAAHLATEPLDLPETVARGAFSSVESLDGAVALAPLAPGELLQRSAVSGLGAVPDGAEPSSHEFSFSVERYRAVNGALRPGERVDLMATYGTGESASTTVIARRVPVLATDEGPLSIGSGGTTVLTVGLADSAEVIAAVHATVAASITVVRSTRAGEKAPGPDGYTPPRVGEPR